VTVRGTATITANFDRVYTVIVTADEGGQILSESSFTVLYGETIVINANPRVGDLDFSGWSVSSGDPENVEYLLIDFCRHTGYSVW
jgi:hypothetical protein